MAQINKPSDYFNTVLYTGNGSAGHEITGVGFQPDWTWIKNRDYNGNHMIYDVIRGVTKALFSNDTAAENTSSGHLTAFGTDGFTLGDNSGTGSTNGNNNAYASWNWKAGGAGSANTDGATASTVSVNNTAGFSIVKWTGTSGNTTVGHGMNTAPVFTIAKNYGGSGMNWIVYHKSISPDYAIKLNTQDVQSNSNNYWQSTAPTNSLLTFTGNTASNSNGNNMIAYCFAEKKGFSKFGKYTGNGNTDGPFIYTGFKPAWVLVKTATTQSGHWRLSDNKRMPFNSSQNLLFPSSNSAESTSPTGNGNDIEYYSNGFKITADNVYTNGNGNSFIYMAFAEEPLVANVRQSIPATAR